MAAWWRRDPSLWGRSPIHRYAQRPRFARCFSRKGIRAAQHRDDGKERPSSLSNLEWVQLQQCRRWKRRFEEDPYRALFGASEDMLKGKGLRNWEWAFKTFPRWIVDEIGLGKITETKEKQNTAGARGEDTIKTQRTSQTSHDNRYPRKVNIVDGSIPTNPKPSFPEPLSRSFNIEYDFQSSGVASPSDPRRVREHLSPRTIGNDVCVSSPDAFWSGNQASTPPTPPTSSQEQPVFTDLEVAKPSVKSSSASKEHHEGDGGMPREILSSESTPASNYTKAQNALGKETSCFEELFGRTPETGRPRQQTTLDRMSARYGVNGAVAPHGKMISNASGSSISSCTLQMKTQAEVSKPLGPHLVEDGIQWTKDMSTNEPNLQHLTNEEWLDKPDLATEQVLRKFPDTANCPNPPASIGKRLESLTRDDIDLLCASDIRASMGHAKNRSPDEKVSGQKLKESFETLYGNEKELPSVPEAKILSDKQVRRRHNELKHRHNGGGRKATERKYSKAEQLPCDTAVYLSRTKAISMMERALGEMSLWLEAGGTVHESDQAEGSPFAMISKAVLVSQRSTARARKDLASDIPAIQPLLFRLRATEMNIIVVGSWDRHRGLQSPYLINAIQSPTRNARTRRRYLADLSSVGEAYQHACKAIDELSTAAQPYEALELRLRQAVELLDMTTKLSSMLAFGLQLPLAIPPRGDYIKKKLRLARHILTLHETQIAIRRLAERMMLVTSISPRTTKDSEASTSIEETSLQVERLCTKEIPTEFGFAEELAHTGEVVYKTTKLDYGTVGCSEVKATSGSVEASPIRSVSETAPKTPPHPVEAASYAYLMPKEDDISPTVTASSKSSTASPERSINTIQPTVEHLKSDGIEATTAPPTEISVPIKSTTNSAEIGSRPSANQCGEHQIVIAPSNTTYTIYTYDAQNDEMLLTTSSATSAYDSSTESISLHSALAILTHPSKFLSHIPPNSNIILAKPDMVVVRPTLEPIITTTRIAASDPNLPSAKDDVEMWKGINPIDGTARLSPTGFMGDGLDLERDFEERRRAAGEYHGKRRVEEETSERGERKAKRAGGVVKTAIVAAATCYVVGVVAEIVR